MFLDIPVITRESILLTYLLTYGADPFLRAANCAATQELPSILWNMKVHYRAHKSPPLVPVLSYINSILSIPSYLSKIHFNIVRPPTSWYQYLQLQGAAYINTQIKGVSISQISRTAGIFMLQLIKIMTSLLLFLPLM
jgi:hypothetical protein